MVTAASPLPADGLCSTSDSVRESSLAHGAGAAVQAIRKGRCPGGVRQGRISLSGGCSMGRVPRAQGFVQGGAHRLALP